MSESSQLLTTYKEPIHIDWVATEAQSEVLLDILAILWYNYHSIPFQAQLLGEEVMCGLCGIVHHDTYDFLPLPVP